MWNGRARDIALAAGGVMVLFAVTLTIYAALWAVDFLGTAAPPTPLALWQLPGTADTMAGLGEVTVAILGIAITVSAIIVELAANRYTARITEMFVRDPINVAVLGFMMITSVMVLWVEMSLYGPSYPSKMVVVTLAMMTVSLLLVLPYFAYVFDFLSPTQVVRRIEGRAIHALRSAARGRPVERARRDVLVATEQLGDIALNSVEKKDKAISIAAVNALSGVIQESLRIKRTLPPDWFSTADLALEDPDFVAFHPRIVHALEERRTWLEMKILRQFQAIFGESLHVMRDVNHLVSIRTAQDAEVAARAGDDAALRLALRFLNTYLRAAINGKDVRTAYNLLNDLRGLAEALLDAGRDDHVLELGERIKFYGQLAFVTKLPFIQITAAHDLCELAERVAERDRPCHDALLQVFLELDRQPGESETQEASLLGVRKAQVKLASFYLLRGERDRARRIFEDMRREPPARVDAVRLELEAIDDPEYWEVSDRGINFDFIPAERRPMLSEFFAWFEEEWRANGARPADPGAR